MEAKVAFKEKVFSTVFVGLMQIHNLKIISCGSSEACINLKWL